MNKQDTLLTRTVVMTSDSLVVIPTVARVFGLFIGTAGCPVKAELRWSKHFDITVVRLNGSLWRVYCTREIWCLLQILLEIITPSMFIYAYSLELGVELIDLFVLPGDLLPPPHPPSGFLSLCLHRWTCDTIHFYCRSNTNSGSFRSGIAPGHRIQQVISINCLTI